MINKLWLSILLTTDKLSSFRTALWSQDSQKYHRHMSAVKDKSSIRLLAIYFGWFFVSKLAKKKTTSFTQRFVRLGAEGCSDSFDKVPQNQLQPGFYWIQSDLSKVIASLKAPFIITWIITKLLLSVSSH